MEPQRPLLVLASSSTYRASVLAGAGYAVEVDPPGVDERSYDQTWALDGPEALAVQLAVAKAEAVLKRHPAALVLAADQVGVLDTAAGPVMLTKRPTVAGAVEQLMAMSGTTHRLVNGLVLIDTATGASVHAIDEQSVTMRSFSEAEALEYVERFSPYDTAGSYRLEDGPAMAPLEPFVTEVVGEHDSGVLGMPLPLLGRLIGRVEQQGRYTDDGSTAAP